VGIRLIMEETDPRQLLVKVASILKDLQVPYAVTGGMAVFVWGRPRFTADIDIVIMLEAKEASVFRDALKEISRVSYIDSDAIETALRSHGEFNFIDGVSGIKVDFWVSKNDAFAKNQLERRIGKEILGETIYFMSPEDLILSKLLWYREGKSSKHLEDIESILKIQKKVDYAYIEKWAKLHRTDEVLEPLIAKIKGE